MRNIRLENVTKSFHGEKIIDNLSLSIPSGKIFVLLGPSGSGKTTILRLIAGFEKADSGHIFLGENEITTMPINERHINTVFQNYALFPHLNVFENIAFSQRIKGVPQDIIQDKVNKVVKIAHLEKHINKSIAQLSGGQQQRVALARAIINEPDVLLLDEPLAALDPRLREKVLVDLIDLQSTLKSTFVYVTHDQFEALTVADNMAIMNTDGEIEQIGTPKEIYEFPISSFVASFVGSTNIFKGTYHTRTNKTFVDVEGLGAFEAPESKKELFNENSSVLMSLRPEKIEISKSPLTDFTNMLQGIVQSIIYNGRSTQYNVRLSNDQIIQVFEQNEEHFAKEAIDYDDQVYLYWQKDNVVLLQK
jgi:spermidine/putrescine transport system ATP-binding protein